jgi:membrane-bound ClpP family serine protease
MLGKIGKIQHWQENEGQVFVNGELWRAVSDVPLLGGHKIVVQSVEGLTLRVKPFKHRSPIKRLKPGGSSLISVKLK